MRVICIAPNYKKYDFHAVRTMETNIELWTYRLFKNSTLYLEEVFSKSYESTGMGGTDKGKSSVTITAGKKGAITRATGSYTFEQHVKGKSEKVKNFALAIQDFTLGLDSGMVENPKKFYVAYKTSQNIVCMEIHSRKITLYIKLDPKKLDNLPQNGRDMTNIGHYGTGDLEITVADEVDLEVAKRYIEAAYEHIGG